MRSSSALFFFLFSSRPERRPLYLDGRPSKECRFFRQRPRGKKRPCRIAKQPFVVSHARTGSAIGRIGNRTDWKIKDRWYRRGERDREDRCGWSFDSWRIQLLKWRCTFSIFTIFQHSSENNLGIYRKIWRSKLTFEDQKLAETTWKINRALLDWPFIYFWVEYAWMFVMIYSIIK